MNGSAQKRNFLIEFFNFLIWQNLIYEGTFVKHLTFRLVFKSNEMGLFRAIHLF